MEEAKHQAFHCLAKSHTLGNQKLLWNFGRGTQLSFEVVFSLNICVITVHRDMCLLVLCHPETISSWRGVHSQTAK